MSLRHALLGLLTEEPASGYDLTTAFDQALSHYAWHAKHSQIYPELNRMAADGLIEVVAEGARGKRIYGITTAGRTELRDWLHQPAKRVVIRSEYMLRLFLLSTLDAEDAVPLLREIAGQNDRELTALRELLDRAGDHLEDGPQVGTLAGEYGLRAYAMTRDWANWAVERLTPRPDPAEG